MRRTWLKYRLIYLVIMVISMSGCEKYINDINTASKEVNSKEEQSVSKESASKQSTSKQSESEKSDTKQPEPPKPILTVEEVLMADEQEVKLKDNEIGFSKTKYFYSDSIDIEILSNKPGEIYYTVDGTEPANKKQIYEKPITINAGDTVVARSLKAKAFFDDGTESEVITHTYFVGKDIATRFDTLIISVNTDPYNLYDYEYGIFVEGKLRDDYKKANPGARIDPDEPANFNMRGRESEREVYLEMFEPNGIQVVNQKAGIRTYGGWSRARTQKSFRMFARKEYDTAKNKFRYEFFPFKTSSNGEGDSLDSFKQLVVRSCGNDHGVSFIRDELFHTLAGIAGYKDYEAVRPVAVFINGGYHGFYWLHEVYCDEYFEDHYGKYEGSFEVLQWGEYYEEPDVLGGDESLIPELEDIYDTFSSMDLTDDNNFNSLCEAIDVENYLDYFAINIYIGNEDWPHNNYRLYRYYPAPGEKAGEAPFDGKWRFLIHDMDFSFGIYGSAPTTDFLGRLIRENGASPLFSQLMKRSDCREMFVRKSLDLANGAFSPDNLDKILEQMNESRMNEIMHTFGTKMVDNWLNQGELNKRVNDIKKYGAARKPYIIDKYLDYFDYGSIYELEVKPADGCKVKINSYVTDSSFSGSFYTSLNTAISAILPEGKTIDYWTVNGERVEGDELVITESMIMKNKVQVSFVIK